MHTLSKENNIISKIIFGIWIGIVLISVWLMRQDMFEIFLVKRRYIRLIELLTVLAIVCEGLCFKKNFNKWSDRKKSILIFIVALGIRVIFLLSGETYVPTSDFNNYFLGACHFCNNGFQGGVYGTLEMYGIPSFAGQAIINGFILNILSPTLLGMQLLNSIYTAGICLMIFLLGKKVDERAAIIGAILYTFYPCSILSTHITTNHHGAAFFILLGIFYFFKGLEEEKIRKRVFFLVISAICLSISNYYHPSVIIVLCAFFVYMFVHELRKLISMRKSYIKELWKEIKGFSGIFILTVTLIVLYVCIYGSTITIIKESGYYKSENPFPLLGKFVVGFNFEADGAYNAVDGPYILSFPEEERTKVCLEMIEDRIRQHGWKETAKLLIQKNQAAWFGTDNYYWFFEGGIRNEISEKIETVSDPVLKSEYEGQAEKLKYSISDMSVVNSFFVFTIWFFAIIGIVKILNEYKDDNIMYMMMYIPLGWMAFIMLTEMQPRYRYQGMTIIILAAGFGIETVRKCLMKGYHKLWQSLNNKNGGRYYND